MSAEAASDAPWIIRYGATAGATIRLFCFPYAGAGAWVFAPWSRSLRGVDICGVELPGHGSRLSEPRYTRLNALVRRAAAALRPYLDMPFALFGHSIGGLVAFELTRTLRRERLSLPTRLFVSALAAPHIYQRASRRHDMPDGELVKRLAELGGTPSEILADPELAELFLPIIRSDLQLLDTYEYLSEEPLACPITAFGGADDPLTNSEALAAWRDQTSAAFSFQTLPGGHFFLNTHRSELLQALTGELEPAAPR